MSESKNSVELLLRQYDHAVSRFTFESEQQVARNNFFMIFQGVIIAGFLSAIKDIDKINTASIFFPLFALLFLLMGIFQAMNAAGTVRMIFVTSSRVVALEQKILSMDGGLDYFVYSGVNSDEIMKEEIRKSKERAVRERRKLGGLIERLTLCFIYKNKYVARNNLYAAWTFCLFWAAVFFYFLWKQFLAGSFLFSMKSYVQ